MAENRPGHTCDIENQKKDIIESNILECGALSQSDEGHDVITSKVDQSNSSRQLWLIILGLQLAVITVSLDKYVIFVLRPWC